VFIEEFKEVNGRSKSVPRAKRIDYFRKLIRRDRADSFLVIRLPVQDNEFDRFLQVNPPLVLVNGAHPHMPHTVVDRVQRVYMATWNLILDLDHRCITLVGAQ
jgi:DNA-binding LacI/PurR family transcriptional regulator